MREKVVLGLSGGVDSAVAARLLQRGDYEVIGLFLDIGLPGGVEEARSAAESLGVPLTVLDIHAELEEKVCSAFEKSYLRGETPNPCILCNPAIKFRALAEHADAVGAKFIATGHYARAEGGYIKKGMPSNDQSYMLCRLLPEQAARLLLPLGGYEKTQVRALAAEFGIPCANKPDSMEICFIPDKDYIGWLSRRAPMPPPGDFVFHGEVIGRHEGIHRYTVGQRRPGLYNERKLYISAIHPEDNTVELALWEELFKTEVRARNMNWIVPPPTGEMRASVKVRHTKWENPACSVIPTEEGGVIIRTDEPVRAPAPGQSAVLYDGDILLGGGFIY